MTTTSRVRRKAKDESRLLSSDPAWYKDAVIYELNVKSFYDSNGDGIGDFRGLVQKLDYIQNLGATAIWLLPFYLSPQKDDGYDISDYYGINPDYGTLNDFKLLLKEAHQRGIRVIIELVLNHTSDQHEWFRNSRRAKPGTRWRKFYVWSDTPDKYRDARIIFRDFEQSNWSWDPVAKAYYWHRFYSHQPDLNFDNPAVQRAVIRAMDYWFEMGIDGMRLDAIPYLFEREGTNCENLPETYAFIEKLRAHVDKNFQGKMLLAEANQWPEDAVAYFGDGDRCHMAFHFPIMPRLFMAAWMEDRFPIIDIFDQTPRIPDQCQWALFLRNHDELTLEMVSDEERDYMYRVFAKDPTMRINFGIRRRLAPLLGNNRRKIELMNILLFSFPGTPVLYYGDEIGMGDNHYLGDRNGVRTPMQWNGDRNAGFSRANPQSLFLPAIIDPDYHYETLNVENQQRNQSSLFWWMKRVISMRRKFKAFGRGTLEFLDSSNPKVLTFVRRYEDEIVLVVANLSRFSQAIELDISRFEGYVPEEVVSGNKFPVITKEPYLFTLGFYDYYWFSLQKEEKRLPVRKQEDLPVLSVDGPWENILEGKNRERLEREILPSYLESVRWFGGKARTLQQARITERIPVHMNSLSSELVFIDVRYAEGSNETYLLPLAFAVDEEAQTVGQSPMAVIALLKTKAGQGALYDAAHSEQFQKQLLSLILRKQKLRGKQGELVSNAGRSLRKRTGKELLQLPSRLLKAEQSNTSMIYGADLLMKLYRKLDEGVNPDLEIGRFLTEAVSFPNVPAFAGNLEYHRRGAEPVVIGILQDFVQNQGDAWSFTLNHASAFLEQVEARKADIGDPPVITDTLLDLSNKDLPVLMQELIGGFYLEMVRLIGKRTAEMHLALAKEPDDSRFAPEPFSLLYQRSLYHSMRTLTRRVFQLLRENVRSMKPEVSARASAVVPLEEEIIRQFSRLFSKKIPSMKTRVHGDYHLGQLLFTGNDFVIIDFEGEPARSIGERRLKRSPLRDVAGMIRSFHYPCYSILYTKKSFSPEEIAALEPWAECWYKYTASVFLRAYVETVADASFIPPKSDGLELLLNAYLLEKAIYEVAYELNNRPDWATIPLKGIADLAGAEE